MRDKTEREKIRERAAESWARAKAEGLKKENCEHQTLDTQVRVSILPDGFTRGSPWDVENAPTMQDEPRVEVEIICSRCEGGHHTVLRCESPQALRNEYEELAVLYSEGEIRDFWLTSVDSGAGISTGYEVEGTMVNVDEVTLKFEALPSFKHTTGNEGGYVFSE